jgi:hypothetical protein
MEVLEEGRKNSFSDLNSFYEPPDSWNTPKFTEIEEWTSLDLNFLEIFQNSKTQTKEINKRDTQSFIKLETNKKIQIKDQDSSEGSPRRFIESPKLPDSPASGSEDLEAKERVVTKSFSIFSKQKSTSTAVFITNPSGEQSSSSHNLLENLKSKLNIKKELSTLKKDTPQSMSSRFRSTFFQKKDEKKKEEEKKKSARMTLKTGVNIPILPINNLNTIENKSADPSPRNESIGSPKSRFSGIFTPKVKPLNLSPKYSFLQKNTSPPLSDMSSPQKIKPLNKTPKHSPKDGNVNSPNTFRNRVEKQPLEASPESQQQQKDAPNTYRTSKERKTHRTSNPKDSPKVVRTFDQYPQKISIELERNTNTTTTTTSNSSSEGNPMDMKFGAKKGFDLSSDVDSMKSPNTSRRKSSFPEQITRKSSFVKYFQNEQTKSPGNLAQPKPIHRWESDHQSKKGDLQQFVLSKRNSDGGSTKDLLTTTTLKEDEMVYPSNSQIITKEPEILLSNSQIHKRSTVEEFNIVSPPSSARHERSQTISNMNFFESSTDNFDEEVKPKKAPTSVKTEVKTKDNSKNSWNLFISKVNQFMKTDTVLTSNASFANHVPENMKKQPQFDHSVFSELNPFQPGATLNEMLWEAGV